MRILSGIFGILLVVFVVVQWNDPDGPMWMVIYGIGATWCFLAAFHPALYSVGTVAGLFVLCLIASIVGLIYFWPQVTDWWDIDVWWPEVTGETSREGMGMMVLVLFMLAPAFVLRRVRSSRA
jgi:hypothetical protein